MTVVKEYRIGSKMVRPKEVKSRLDQFKWKDQGAQMKISFSQYLRSHPIYLARNQSEKTQVQTSGSLTLIDNKAFEALNCVPFFKIREL